MKQVFLFAFLMITFPVWAQQFATMIGEDNVAFLRDFRIIATDGTVYEAEKLSAYQATSGRIKSLAFNNKADGQKIRLKAEEIMEVIARMTNMAKVATIADQASKSIRNAVTTDYSEIVRNNLVRFNSVTYNQKSGKKALLQLVNYGFDQKIKVYPDPNSESGTSSVNGVAISGGAIKAYFLVVGEHTYTVDKNAYRRAYEAIFDGCAAMKTDAKSIAFTNLCSDILRFNADCE